MIDRRLVLKAMLTVPLTTKMRFLSTSKLPKVSVTQLKIYVHGLFAHVYNAFTGQIELYPPVVRMPGHSHIYRAGSFTPPVPCKNPSIHEPDLLQGEEYHLHLENYVNEGSFPILPYDSAACLPMKSLYVDKSLCFCTIALPQTDQLQAKHRVKRNDGKAIFEGPDVATFDIHPTYLARTFVFTYQNPKDSCGKSDPFQPVLLDKYDNEIWRPRAEKDSLHIFAEPPHSIQEKQEQLAIQAFDRLRTMLGLQLYPVSFVLRNYDSEKANEPIEELSTGEREANLCGTRAGGEVMNCVGVIVNLQQ